MEIRIIDLAKRCRCEVVTIRYHEKEGLLPKPGAKRWQLPAVR